MRRGYSCADRDVDHEKQAEAGPGSCGWGCVVAQYRHLLPSFAATRIASLKTGVSTLETRADSRSASASEDRDEEAEDGRTDEGIEGEGVPGRLGRSRPLTARKGTAAAGGGDRSGSRCGGARGEERPGSDEAAHRRGERRSGGARPQGRRGRQEAAQLKWRCGGSGFEAPGRRRPEGRQDAAAADPALER